MIYLAEQIKSYIITPSNFNGQCPLLKQSITFLSHVLNFKAMKTIVYMKIIEGAVDSKFFGIPIVNCLSIKRTIKIEKKPNAEGVIIICRL